MPLKLVPIVPKFYQGPESAASDVTQLRAIGITHILSLGARGPKGGGDDDGKEAMCTLRIGCEDGEGTSLASICHQAFPFIEEGMASGGGVLVHCKAGLSRSPSVVAAFLVAKFGMSPGQAFELITKQTGRKVRPNLHFQKELEEMYMQIIGS